MAWYGSSRKCIRCLGSPGGDGAGSSVCALTLCIPWPRCSSKALRRFLGTVSRCVVGAKNWQLEVGLEQVEDGEVWGILPISDRAAFEDEPAVRALHLGQLIVQTGFADAGLPDKADDLPTPLFNVRESLTQCCKLPLSAHE